MRPILYFFIAIVTLTMLRVAFSLPIATQGQEPQPHTRAGYSLQQRLHEPHLFTDSVDVFSSSQPRLGSDIPQVPSAYCDQWPPWDDVRSRSKVAFASYRDSDWEIYIFNADYSAPAARLTYSSGYDSTPKLNRGATRITFVSRRDGNYEIYVMNANGTNQTRLTSHSANDLWPTWSPDGSRIAFYSNRDGDYEVFVMNADGSNQVQLTHNTAWDGHPDWSPDGSLIAFASDRSGNDEIWVMSANGSNQRQLSSGAAYAAFPRWSSDGSRLAINEDSNGDYWLDYSILNASGGIPDRSLTVHQVERDYLAPVYSPDDSYLASTRVDYVFYQGSYYWWQSQVFADCLSANSSVRLDDSQYDWWADWEIADLDAPASQVSRLPLFTPSPSIPVSWSGYDDLSGIASFDIQYRDGLSGAWADWLTNTPQTSAIFAGEYGHTYYFRSRARDYANNLEPYPNTPDTQTGVYKHVLSGHVAGNREQPVAVANVQASPPAMNTAISNQAGYFDLYFGASGVYSLTLTRTGFGPLPPMHGVLVTNPMASPSFFLPPIDNRMTDGDFESGDLSAWTLSGDLTATITTTAHTGIGAVLLGGVVPSGTVGAGPWHSAIAQQISLSPKPVSATVSILYHVISAEPISDTLRATLIGSSETVTYALPLTSSGWTHMWFDVPGWEESAATLRIELSLGSDDRPVNVILDEVSLGPADVGSYPVFLPIVLR